MSSLTRSISRGIARKNGTLKPSRGKSPNYRGQIFRQRASKKDDVDGMFARMFNAIFGRKAKKMNNLIHLYGKDERFAVPDYVKNRLLATSGKAVTIAVNKRGGNVWKYCLQRKKSGMLLIDLTIWTPIVGGIYRGMKPDERVQNFPVWSISP